MWKMVGENRATMNQSRESAIADITLPRTKMPMSASNRGAAVEGGGEKRQGGRAYQAPKA